MPARGQRVLVATMRDEAPFILEWLAYHRLIGFDHIVVYSNDCWDQTAELLDAVASRLGFVTHFDNSRPTGHVQGSHHDPQRRAYQRAWMLPVVRDAEFIMVLDADEFLNIHTGNGTLGALIAAAPPFDAISLTWRLFGTSGHIAFEDRPVIEQFTRCRPDKRPSEVRKWGVKTLFRPHLVEKLGVHRPYHIRSVRDGTRALRWVNGSGKDVFDRYRESHWFAMAESHGRDLAEVNHYAIKSSEAFLMKKRRGSANSTDADRLGLEYLRLYDHNEVEDHSIQRHLPALKAMLARWMQDVPDLRELHEAAVFFHKTIAAELQARLTATSPDFLSRLGLLSTERG